MKNRPNYKPLLSSADLPLPAVPQPATFNLQPATIALLALLAFSLAGCSGPRPLKGGHATTAGPVAQSIVQGENPSQPTRQDQETIKVRTYVIPAGTRIEQSPPPQPATCNLQPATLPAAPTTLARSDAPTFVTLSTPTVVTEREETRAKTELGAAQKDTAREFAAKLSSLKGIVWVGVALFIFGLASLFWPPLKAIVGSITTSAAITIGGIALMILPTLIVGNELLILGGVVLAVAIWFFAHRHGQLRGLLDGALHSALPTPQSALESLPAPAQSAESALPTPQSALKSRPANPT